MRNHSTRFKAGAVALSLTIAAALPAVSVSAHAFKKVSSDQSGFGIQSAPTVLLSTTPVSYQSAWQRALTYLGSKVQPTGAVISGSGQPASTASTAYAAVALALSGQSAVAESIAGWLLKNQNTDGGWGATPGSAASDMRDTALAVWALGEVGHVSNPSLMSANLTHIESGVNYLVSLQSPIAGTFANSGGLADAEDNAIAVRALQVAAYTVAHLGHERKAKTWTAAAVTAYNALAADNGVARTSTTDMLASALWGLTPTTTAAQREVGAANDLSFAYLGFGTKSGPGYYTGMDWINGVSTFNYAIAAARAGLPDLAVAQYNYGLKLQNTDGGFGAGAHPPVGPETGSFAAGPSSSSVTVTAHYLLATHTLLTQGALGFGWDSATVSQNGSTNTENASKPALDPAISMRPGPRIAVLVGSPSVSVSAAHPAGSNASELALQMNVAYELTQMGYRVTLFWYKPNQAEQFYNLNAFWNSLSSFQDVIASNGTFAFNNGFKASFAAHQQQFSNWLSQGGRFIDAGDNGTVPFLGVQVQTVQTPIQSVQFTSEGRSLGAQSDLSQTSTAWPGAATAYYASAPGYTVFANGQVGSQQLPVAIGEHVGAGRVLLTTLSVGNASQDRAPVFAAMFKWANRGVQVANPQPVNYAAAAQQLYKAMQQVYAIPGTNLYKEHNVPQSGDRTYSYLWPFSQAFGGVAASASSLAPVASASQLLTNLATGLAQYYNASSTPPGYDSYVLSQGGGTLFFDDNGWITLDLLRSYQDTGNKQFLTLAENAFTFLTSGWSKSKLPPGGEYFNTGRIGRTQTATGSVMDAALRLYLATHNPIYLNFGEQAYHWDRTYIKGVNGLYNDGISPNGVVGGTPFTYDTGVVLQADVLLYRITNNPKYLARADLLATEGLTLYTDPLTGLMINNAGQSNAPFNEIFLRGLLMLYKAHPKSAFLRYAERQANIAHQYGQYPNGIYGINWSGINDPTQPVDLLTQGATLRLFGMLAAVTGGGDQAQG